MIKDFYAAVRERRIIVLFKDHHDKLWDITKEALRKIVPENKFASTEQKINSFSNLYHSLSS